jgi:hypothetical protein
VSGRPPGHIRKYTVENMWPAAPGRWRTCVEDADEPTARRSVKTLWKIGHACRIKITFVRPNRDRDVVERIMASEWDQRGRCVLSYDGERRSCVPGWALGDIVRQD